MSVRQLYPKSGTRIELIPFDGSHIQATQMMLKRRSDHQYIDRE